MKKEEKYNQSILQMVYELVASCGHNWQKSKYLSIKCGNKNLDAYNQAIKKVDDILERGVENITEAELYWILSYINGKVIYNGQHIDSHLFVKRLYFKLQKSNKDSFNNNRLVKMLNKMFNESKFLRMYVIEQGE